MPSLNAARKDVSSSAINRGIIEIQINQSVLNGGKDAVIKSPDNKASKIFFAGSESIYQCRVKILLFTVLTESKECQEPDSSNSSGGGFMQVIRALSILLSSADLTVILRFW